MSNEKKELALSAPAALPPDQDRDITLGEYLLHIYIRTTLNLKIQEPVDSIIKVTAFDQTKYTRIKKDVVPDATAFWGEHIFFNHTFTSRTELEDSHFNISVFDHNVVFKNALIGATSYPCLNVYSAPEHTKMQHWAILTNSKEEIATPFGFVQFSVNFVRAGEKRTNLEGDYDPKSGKNALKTLEIPPELQMKQKQLIIRLYRGARIVKMDSTGAGADPYVKVNFGGLKIKSDYKKNQLTPVFAQNLYIPTIYPSIVNRLDLHFKDYDLIGSNEYIGAMSFKLSDIEKGLFVNPSWQYFYGAHEDAEDKDFKAKMNRIPEIASRFKGALCMAIELVDRENVAFKKDKMTTQEYQKSEELLCEVAFKMAFSFEYIQNLRGKSQPHKIWIDWGGKKTSSKPVKNNRGVFLVNQEISVEETFELPKLTYDSYLQNPSETSLKRLLKLLPDAIFSIADGKKHISFYRFKPERYPIGRPGQEQSEEVKLHADQAVSDMEEPFAGILRLKLSSGLASEFTRRPPSWFNNRGGLNQQFKKICVICNLFQAKSLMASDDNGMSDPVVQFYHLGSTVQSMVFPNTLNPIWNARIVFESYMLGDSIPSLVLNFWDKDENWTGSRDFEFLGHSLINITPETIVTDSFGKFADPKWHDISLGKDSPAGKVMLSVQVVPTVALEAFKEYRKTHDNFSKLPIRKSRHLLKLNLLGLRSLESTGLFPIKTAGVKIATSSLKNVDNMREGSAFNDLVAIAKTSGSNPTIGTVLTVTADLPRNIQIMPILSCNVQEVGYRLFGSDKSIGTFNVNLGLFSMITKENVIKRLKNVRRQLADSPADQSEIDRLIKDIKGTLTLTKKINDDYQSGRQIGGNQKLTSIGQPRSGQIENPLFGGSSFGNEGKTGNLLLLRI